MPSLHRPKALPENGQLFALDKDDRSMSVARKYWELAGVSHKVTERLGGATESLERLIQEEGPGSFDLAFIDADKRSYWAYYEQLLRLVRPGGLIIADNVSGDSVYVYVYAVKCPPSPLFRPGGLIIADNVSGLCSLSPHAPLLPSPLSVGHFMAQSSISPHCDGPAPL